MAIVSQYVVQVLRRNCYVLIMLDICDGMCALRIYLPAVQTAMLYLLS